MPTECEKRPEQRERIEKTRGAYALLWTVVRQWHYSIGTWRYFRIIIVYISVFAHASRYATLVFDVQLYIITEEAHDDDATSF